MNINSYFYKTFMYIANEQGFTVKQLARVCGLNEKTLSKQLKKADGCDLTSNTSHILRDKVAPDKRIQDLFREAADVDSSFESPLLKPKP